MKQLKEELNTDTEIKEDTNVEELNEEPEKKLEELNTDTGINEDTNVEEPEKKLEEKKESHFINLK